MAAVEEGSGGSVYAGPRVRVRRGRRAKLPDYRLPPERLMYINSQQAQKAF